VTDDIIERDPELARLLSSVSGEAPVDQVDWARLRGETVARMSAQVALQRRVRRRWRAFMGTAMAASVALLFMVSRAANVESDGTTFAGGKPTIEEILATDASDEELRALLSGAGDAELLLLAASDSE
jgi:hypothetical protein